MSSWKDVEVSRRIRAEVEALATEATDTGDGSAPKLKEALGRLKGRRSLLAQDASADLELAAARANDPKLAERIKIARTKLSAVLFD